jgi:hypothetical protein
VGEQLPVNEEGLDKDDISVFGNCVYGTGLEHLNYIFSKYWIATIVLQFAQT